MKQYYPNIDLGGKNKMKMELNMVLIIGIVVMGAIAIVSLIKGASNEIVVGAIAATAGLLTGPVVSKAGAINQTVDPNAPTSLGGNADPDQTGAPNITVGSTTGNGDAAAVINPVAQAVAAPAAGDLINQAIQAIQNNPALLQNVVAVINTVENNPTLLTQVSNLLNTANGDLNQISIGIAQIQALIPNAKLQNTVLHLGA